MSHNSFIDFYKQQILPKLTFSLIYKNVDFTFHRGKYWRGRCPLHQGDNPTAFCVNAETLAWNCFTRCGKGSALAFINGGSEPKGKDFVSIVYELADLVNTPKPRKFFASHKDLDDTSSRNSSNNHNKPFVINELSIQTIEQSFTKYTYGINLKEKLQQFQSALPGSLGEKYLLHRKIPLYLAQQYGVGYAIPGTWPHKSRDWKWGRLVFPHTNPNGEIINLYGRAVGSTTHVPKELRHDHLPGSKAYFNGQLMKNTDKVFICEGPFDAISLAAAGYPNSVAIFGINGWRWDWSKNTNQLIFALDNDQAGTQWKDLARQACLRGKQVSFLSPESYGNNKDINEAWMAGVLNVGL